MGLEILLSSKAIAYLLIFCLSSIFIVRKIFNSETKEISWLKIGQGFLGVLVALIFWSIIITGFKFKGFLEYIIFQSYFAFPWTIFVVMPIFFGEVIRSEFIIKSVMKKIGFIVFMICMLIFMNSIIKNTGINFNDILQILICAVWLLSISYIFSFFMKIRLIL
jgi:hypothetical protein